MIQYKLKNGLVLVTIVLLFATLFSSTIVLSSDNITGFSPIADFTYNPDDPIIYTHINFKDNSTDTQGEIVSWWWDFDNGYYSDVKNPVHFYNTPGSYNVSLKVTNDTGFSDTVQKEVNVFEDNIPPTVEIVSPEPWNIEFDFFCYKIIIIGPPIFYGRVYVVVNATDNIGVECVEFYIDDIFRDVDYEYPYIWLWNDQSMLFCYELKVVARDFAGNEAVDMKKVWRSQVTPPEINHN
jgi:hypothetical protein